MAGKSQRKSPSTGGGGAEAAAGRRSGGGGAGNAARAARIAEANTSGGGAQLPYFNQVQAAFGHHDISEVRAHMGGEAAASAAQIDAEAYTYGTDIVFGGSPTLHLVAEEATHAVQQGAGEAPSSGLGQEGDRYETFAQQVADRVVAGQSVEAMLDRIASPGRVQVTQPAVQRRYGGKKEVSSKAMSRIGHAKSAIDHTKKVLSHGGGNQKEALQATNFNSYFRMAAMRDPDCWYLDRELFALARANPSALTAAKADLAQGGNCGEHAAIAFDYLRRNAGGETIHKSAKEGLDHAFVVIGDIRNDADDELVVSDPWPTAPTACLWEDHFAYTRNRDDLKAHQTLEADGEDIKAAIAAGLDLSAKGKAMIAQSMSEERTKEEIKKGTEGEKPWIWQHPNAARVEYDYHAREEAPVAPTIETPTPTTPTPTPATTTDTPTSDTTPTSSDTSSSSSETSTSEGGGRDYLGWLRRWAGF